MSFSFHPEAEKELLAAVDYYEKLENGLGYDFALEVQLTLERTVALPEAWAVLEGEIRRSLVRRFPFGVLYSVEDESIYVIAIMNLHRSPGYWKRRI